MGVTTSGPGIGTMLVLSGTVWTPTVSPETMVSVPVSGVALSVFAAVAVTEIVQLALAETLLPHVLLSVKF
ncbi:hypothetical protein [Edaphobacter sp. 12200R-103]|uniref:hypothetical protein n=1 Tax=Edaphobacter sp. 12200R-103 TaxID=2703788 RepID=UPI00138B9ECF|nr:hypothetical protein [Edaphobacter sp. 12200R-103]QHS51915.1 hypothetical protein GWR55_09320 [Edaphobacter sp. 12200R-103]